MSRRKSTEQQEAWSELLLLINDPEWYLDKQKSKRHKQLMLIIENEEDLTISEKNDIRYQRYVDARPGMEEDIVELLKQEMPVSKLRGKYRIDPRVFAYLRRKHKIKKYQRLQVPSKEELEETYREGGWKAAAEKYKASQPTVYYWMKKYGIERNHMRS